MTTPHGIAAFGTLTLGVVVANDDPESRGRIKVRLDAIELELWAAMVVPSAGKGYGVSLLPRRGEVVVVGFVTPELPLVLGSVWAGTSAHPSSARPVEENWTVRTPKGSQLRLDDGDGPRVVVTTPAGNKIELTDAAGGEALIDVQGTRVRVTTTAVEVQASAKVDVQAGQVKITAGMVDVDAAMVRCSGVVKCETLVATAVVGGSYTPGAGNIW